MRSLAVAVPGNGDRLRLALALAVYAAIVAIGYREQNLGPLLDGVTSGLALTSALLLELIGLAPTVNGDVVMLASGKAYAVSYRCTGFLPITCLIVAIAASRARLSDKLAGLGVGIPVLVALNQARIVNLIAIDAASPANFRFAHDVVWGGIPVLAVVALFGAWRHWARRVERRVDWRVPTNDLTKATRDRRRGGWPVGLGRLAPISESRDGEASR